MHIKLIFIFFTIIITTASVTFCMYPGNSGRGYSDTDQEKFVRLSDVAARVEIFFNHYTQKDKAISWSWYKDDDSKNSLQKEGANTLLFHFFGLLVDDQHKCVMPKEPNQEEIPELLNTFKKNKSFISFRLLSQRCKNLCINNDNNSTFNASDIILNNGLDNCTRDKINEEQQKNTSPGWRQKIFVLFQESAMRCFGTLLDRALTQITGAMLNYMLAIFLPQDTINRLRVW